MPSRSPHCWQPDIDVAVLQVGEAIENISSTSWFRFRCSVQSASSIWASTPTGQGAGLRRRGHAVPVHDGAKGHAARRVDRLVEGLKATFATDDYKAFNEQNSLTPMEEPGDEVLSSSPRTSSATPIWLAFGIDSEPAEQWSAANTSARR